MPIAIALVLIGIITLAVGVFSAAVGWVYVSIGATALAGVVLFVVHQSGHRRPSAAPPAADAGDATAPPAGATEVAAPPPVDAGDAGTPPALITAPPADAGDAGAAPVAATGDVAADVAFPIAGYEELRVTEVLPLLASLDAAALAEVRRRETQTKGRATVLARIDELLGPPAGLPADAPDAGRPDTADAGRPDTG